MPDRRLKTVYFDVGGTILTASPSVGAIYADAVRRLGFSVDAGDVQAKFRQAWRRSLERRRANGYRCDDIVLRHEWLQVVIESFEGLIGEETARQAFDDLYERFRGPSAWKLAPGAVLTFQALKAWGLRLGLLSNWDERLEDLLGGLGIIEYFDHRVISCQVGVEKPHPRIFAEALRQAGNSPEQILHVGDSYEWDIEPARLSGMHTLWINADDEALGTGGQIPAARVKSFEDVLPFIESWTELRGA